MSVRSVEIAIPVGLDSYLYMMKGSKTIRDKLVLSAVIDLFTAKVITLEKAAELNDKGIWSCIEILKMVRMRGGMLTDGSCGIGKTGRGIS